MSNSRMRVSSYLLAGILTSVLIPIGVIGATTQEQVITQKSGERIRAILSSSSINRISFDKSPIAQIVGDESEYSVLTDEMGINIFLVPKVPAGEKIELTLISTSGAIADLTLRVADTSGQVIEIGKDVNKEEISKYEKDSVNEIANMLKYMIKDEQGKYYVKELKRKINNSNRFYAEDSRRSASLEIIQDRSYRFGNLSGARLIVKAKNLSKKESVSLIESDFKSLFEGARAVSIMNKTLLSGGNSLVYVIAEEVKND